MRIFLWFSNTVLSREDIFCLYTLSDLPFVLNETIWGLPQNILYKKKAENRILQMTKIIDKTNCWVNYCGFSKHLVSICMSTLKCFSYCVSTKWIERGGFFFLESFLAFQMVLRVILWFMKLFLRLSKTASENGLFVSHQD